MKKLRFCVCIILCLSILPLSVFAVDAPIEISTEAQLKNITNNLNGNYILTDDITLSENWTNIGTSSNYFTGTFDGNGYTIKNLNINASKDFKGLFGYAVGATFKNLTVEGNITVYGSTDESYSNIAAICGGAKECTFLNCTNNANVKGNKNVGGICGRAYGSTFTNCENNGIIIADENAGGICGRVSGCSLSLLRNYGDVSAKTHCGGICGIINQYSSYTDTVLLKSFNSASVTSSVSYGGGIVGFAQASTGNIEIANCFNTGNISSNTKNAYLGGILGDCSHSTSNQTTVTNCYSTGKITSNSFSGGISGGTNLRYTNCYYLNNSSLPICSGGSNTALSAEAMLLESSYSGFDFSSIWSINPAADFKYPTLIDNPIDFELSITILEITSLPYNTTYYQSDSLTLDTSNLKLTAYYNDGTVEKNIDSGFTVSTPEFYLGLNPVTVTYKGATAVFPIFVYRDLFEKQALLFGTEYYIPLYSQKNLENISLYPNGKYFVQNDIICDSSFSGICSEDNVFSGLFLGNNKTITLDIQNQGYGALFISASSATICDLVLDGSVRGNDIVGALVAYLSNSQISSITNKASVYAISNATNAYVGAIAGYADFSSGTPYILKCKNLGELSLTSSARTSSLGGLIGHADVSTNNSISISKSHNNSLISLHATNNSSDYIGGIIGSITSVSGSGTLELNEVFSCKQLSASTSSYLYAGGIVGDFNIDSFTQISLTIKNSFSLGPISVLGNPLSVTFGGIISTAAYQTVKLSSCYSACSFDITNKNKGGAIVSSESFSGTVENCYYINDTVSDNYATRLSSLQALETQSYLGFDFSDIWVLNNNFIYPQLVSAPLNFTATEILLTTPPTKLNYTQNTDDFSAEGGELLVKFDNGSAYKVPLSNAQVSGFDNSVLGKKSLTVNYFDKTTTLEVEIIAKPAELERIEITTPPTKLNYFVGEALDLSGLVVTAYYDNSTSNEISGYSVNGFDSSSVGTKTITVSFEGKTDTFEVSVIERPVLVPDKITSSTLNISGETVSKITAGTTVSALLSNINEAQYCAVFNSETQLNGEDIVGTGMLIKLFDGLTVKATYTIIVTGDLDGNGLITDNDAIYLLYSTFLPNMYPVIQDCDFNKDGYVTDQDAIYLLYHTFLPELYPI